MMKDVTQIKSKEIIRLGLYRKFGGKRYKLEHVGTDKKQLLKWRNQINPNSKYRITPVTFYWKNKPVKGYTLRILVK